MHNVFVSVVAASVRDNGNGTFSIELVGKDISAEQSKALDELFPNTREQLGPIFDKEALLSALATPSEIMAPPTNGAKPAKKEWPKS